MPLRITGAAARIPIQDLARARRWYGEKLGLEPVEERPGGLRYLIGEQEFVLAAPYRSGARSVIGASGSGAAGGV